MTTEEKLNKDIAFLEKLKANDYKAPNDFTIEMGLLIRKAREEQGLSQIELAKQINRRPATISDIENGKSEMGVLTLVLFAIVLEKPISYLFPESLFKNSLVDVKSPFEHEMLEMAREIEYFGNPQLARDLLQVLVNHLDNDDLEIPE